MATAQITLTRMEITNVDNQGALKASVNISINDALHIHGLRIIETNGVPHVVWPTRKAKSGRYWPIVAPTTEEVRVGIENAILIAYKNREIAPQKDID